jgi:TRAP-type mannitol/chloroaromatic compound transport system permease small subunit
MPEVTISGMTLRVRRKHWIAFLVFFALQFLGLVVTVFRLNVERDFRTWALMVVCSALVAFPISWIIVSVFERMSANPRA